MSALCVLAFAALLQEAPAAEYAPHVEQASEEGRAAIATFRVPAGFEVELYAAEPLLANPVCLYMDHGGDLYVGETFRHHAGVTDIREHMDWLDDDLATRTVEDRRRMFAEHEGEEGYATYATEHERLRLIRDTDGDGFADTAVVFAQGFNDHAAGIGAGVLAHKGDVYYTCIPDLWLLRDRDGDGVAEERELLSTGYGVNVALLGHDLHGLRIGPDGRLYFSSGDRGFHVETENGPIAHSHTGAVLRCNLDGTGLEVWHSGLRNPQELVFDEYGNLFTGDNNSDGGDEARWVNIIEGGESGWRYSYQWISKPDMRGPWSDERLWHPQHAGQAAYIVPPIANLARGPSGLAHYPGTGFGPDLAGHFFLCDFTGGPSSSGVLTFTAEPRGAFWELGDVEEFAFGMLATDADFGPDGGLYLTDWVSGWNKTGKGRVYRVVSPEHRGSELVTQTRALLARGFEQVSLTELEELLGHTDQRVRQEAQFELVGRGNSGRFRLVGATASDSPRLARLHAIWGLGMVGRTAPEVLDELLPLCLDDDPEVRAQAVRVLGDERYGPAAPALTGRLSDESARVACFAALAVGRLGVADAVEPLTKLIDACGTTDPNLRHAGVMGLLGCASDAEIERLATDPSEHARMAALLVMRRRSSPAIATFLGARDGTPPGPLLVVESARAIHDLPIAEALPALARLVDDPALDLENNALVRRVLNACLRLDEREHAEGLAHFAARADAQPRHRREALEHLALWAAPPPRDRVTNHWRPLEPREAPWLADLVADLAVAMDAAPPRVTEAFATLAASTDARATAPTLSAWVADPGRSPGTRAASLRALGEWGGSAFETSLELALNDAEGELRAAGLAELERQSPELVLPHLPGVLDHGELGERRTAYEILGRTRTPAARALLAEHMRRLAVELVPAELALDLVLAAEAQEDPELDLALGERHAARASDAAVADWLDALFGGDAGRGREVFERADLSCLRCHGTGSEDALTVGPNLAGVTRRLTRLTLLESILDPNRRTTRGFEGTVLFLKTGGALAGRVLDEDADSLRLQLSTGEIEDVPLDAIDERRADVSAMPTGLGELLERRDLRDLLAYLGSL